MVAWYAAESLFVLTFVLLGTTDTTRRRMWLGLAIASWLLAGFLALAPSI